MEWRLCTYFQSLGTRTKFIATTRSRDLLRPSFAKTTKYQGSFRINGARTYNTLPRYIRQIETLSEFKIKLKRHLKQ